MKLKIQKNQIILIFLAFWFTVNFLFLTDYPFVHSDESWLSGLSRSMIESSSLGSTEDFFDLYERNPHAIKILYHLLQIPFLKTFGYTIFSVRLISLLAGCMSLYVFYCLILKFHPGKSRYEIALLTTIWLSLDIQFIYISHLARQEVLLLFIFLSCLNLLYSDIIPSRNRGTIAGLLTGLAVGFHPNSFIIAWPVGLILVHEILTKKRRKTEGLFFLLTAGFTTSIFIALSLYFNADFIQDYRQYGEALGVLETADIKILKLPGFYSKLFQQISGTYHTPNIRMQMILFPLFIIIAFLNKNKKIGICTVLGFSGFNIALAIIGKYSQPSVCFLLPFYYLSGSVIIMLLLSGSNTIALRPLIIIFLGASLFFSSIEISRENESYDDYLHQINMHIPTDSVLLGDLLMDFAVPAGQLYDWRNLYFLKEKNLLLKDYIRDRNIQYIVLTEELSFIYNKRPYWNVLYGNIAHWYPRLIDFTENNCSLVKELNSPAYGMRVAAYRYTKPWYTKIYKVDCSFFQE